MEAAFIVSGFLRDVYTQQINFGELDLAGKLVELWQKKQYFDELVATSVTEKNGAFKLTFQGNDASTPNVYFKVYSDGQPLKVTMNPSTFPASIENQMTLTGNNELALYADLPFSIFEEAEPIITLSFRLLKDDASSTRLSYQQTNLKVYYEDNLLSDLGNIFSNDLGYVKFFAENTKKWMTDFHNHPELFKFSFTLLGAGSNTISSATVNGNTISTFDQAIDVVFTIQAQPEILDSKSITTLTSDLGITIDSELSSYLSTNNLSSLEDLRKIGGLRNQAAIKTEVYDDSRESIQLLDAHAQFEIISSDHAFNHKVTQAGFFSVHQVAMADRSSFVSKIEGAQNYEALLFHRTSFAAAGVFSNVYTERLINRFGDDQPVDTLQDVLNEIEEKCSCGDCETATSPFAYLVDLMNYASKHVKKEFNPTLPSGLANGFLQVGETALTNDLELLFCQKYSQIPVACDELHHKICQYRIAIEILQCYKLKNPPADSCCNSNFEKAEKDFFLSLYHALLEQAGTTYYQLRDVQNDVEKMDKLEEQIAISNIDEDNSINNRPVRVMFKSNAEIAGLSNVDLFNFLEETFGFSSVYRQPYYGTPADTALIELWRKQYLRNNWSKQDSPSDEFSRHEKLIIDPDLIGVDDIKEPHDYTNSIYGLWTSRRVFLDQIWRADFNAIGNPNGSNNSRRAGIVKLNGLLEADDPVTGIVVGDRISVIVNAGLSSIEVLPLTVKAIHSNYVETLESIYISTLPSAITSIDIVKGGSTQSVSQWSNIFGVNLASSLTITEYNNASSVTIYDASPTPQSIGTYVVYKPIALSTTSVSNILLKGEWNGALNYSSIETDTNVSKPIIPTKYDVTDLIKVFELLNLHTNTYSTNIPINTWIKQDTSTTAIALYDFPSTGISLEEKYLNWFNLFVSHLNGSDKLNRENATAKIPVYFNLSVQPFSRLVELFKKYLAQESNIANPVVSNEEWEEIFNILLLSVKNKMLPTWLLEETTISLDATHFYKSLREPKEGNLPVLFAYNEVALDPELVYQNDLPEYEVAQGANAILENRLAYIIAKRSEYLGTVAPTLAWLRDNVLYDVYDSIYPPMYTISGVDYYPLLLDFDNTLAQSTSINAEIANAARYKITNLLKLSVQDFTALMNVLNRLRVGTPVSTDEFSAIVKPLVSVKKIFEKYTVWIQEEAADSDTSTTPIEDYRIRYWFARKATLPKWLANPSDRVLWQQALAERSKVPFVDPDLVTPTDIIKVTHPAFDLWANRKLELQTRWNELQTKLDDSANNTDTKKFEETVKLGLGLLDISHFNMLADIEALREDIRPYLTRLNLPIKAYRRLKQLQHVMEDIGYTNMVDDELNDFKDILLQSIKERELYPKWANEEFSNGIILSPEIFEVKQEPYGGDTGDIYSKLNEWRTTYKARRDWEKKLKARRNQFDKVVENINTANDTVESDLLRIYRDALIAQLGDKTKTVTQNAEDFSQQLLIDFTLNCCQHTTRLSQAIDTLQKLIWEESIGIDHDIKYGTTTAKFTLVADRFEEEWKWMGSYATWRSAMFVFMFPENLLLPSLRKWQSKVFQNIAGDIRGNNRFTPKAACKAVAQYTAYLDDLSKLVPSSTCTTVVPYFDDKCANSNVKRLACTFFSFAVTEVSRRVYFASKDYNGDTLAHHTFWDPVDALQANVTAIIGSPVYENSSSGTKFIFLFATIKEEEVEKLVFVKYNVNNRNWDTDFTELDLPENTDFKDIQILQRQREDAPPKILVRNKETGELNTNELNEFGKKLVSTKWTLISTGSKRSKLASLKAFAEITSGDYIEEFMLGVDLDKGHYIYRLLGVNDEGMWKKATNFSGKFKGLVNINSNRRCIGFFYDQVSPNKSSMMGGNPVVSYTTVTKQVTIKLGSNKTKNALNYTYNTKPGANNSQTVTVNRYTNRLNDYGIGENNANLIASFDQLDWWMISHFGRGLYHCLARHVDVYGTGLAWPAKYISPKAITGGVDLDHDGLTDIFFKRFLDKASWAFVSIDSNYEMHNSSLSWTNYKDWATYRDIFQSFQCNYQKVRKEDANIADKDGRAFCDWLKNWLLENLINYDNKSTNPQNESLRVAFNNANKLIQNIDAPFYTSEPDKDDYHGKELDLGNLLTSLLNFTFDPNGRVYLRGKDYPERYITILGHRDDYVLEENFSFLQDSDSVNPNWGQLYGIGEGGTKENWAIYLTYLSINKLNGNNRAVVQTPEVYSTYYVKTFNNEGEWISSVPPLPNCQQPSQVDQLVDVQIWYWDGIGPVPPPEFERIVFKNQGYLLTPVLSTQYPPTEEISSADLKLRQTYLSGFVSQNYGNPPTHLEYLREAYYFLPILVAVNLSQRGHYDAALKWYKTVYDYTQPTETERKLYSILRLEANIDDYTRDDSNWLLDPLNPHAVASTRRDAYYRYTLYNLSQTFLAFADAQFTLDTIESVSKAEELYEFAHDLIGKSGLLQQKPNECNIKLFEATADFLCEHPEWKEYIDLINRILAQIPKNTDSEVVANEIDEVLLILQASTNPLQGLIDAENYVEGLQNQVAHPILGHITSVHQLQVDNLMFATMSIPKTVSHLHTTIVKVGKDYQFALGLTTAKGKDVFNTDPHSQQWSTDPKQSYSLKYDEVAGPFNHTAASEVGLYHEKGHLFQAVANNPIDALNEVTVFQFPHIPFMNAYNFCIPANPVFRYLNMSAELNLFKIRNCMNIAGMRRELDPYAAPTDLYTGLPQISSTGQLVIPGGTVIKPTIYRYEYLIERAKQVVNIAQQIEAAFLSALEKRDAEYYNLMKAKQDLATSKANVKLKDLQVNASNDEVDLAVMQKEKSQLQVEELDKMISEGLNGFEQQMIGMYYQVALLQNQMVGLDLGIMLAGIAGDISFGTSSNAISKNVELGISSTLGAIKMVSQMMVNGLQANISVSSLFASQARREQQWNFEKVLAQQDIRIGNQQVKIAQDRVRISEQDRRIAELQQQHAEASIDFLSGKFTNVELYDYMGNVLGNVYRYFLQEANGIAKLAQNQIAFERQEAVQSFIQDDYYENPTDNNAITSPGGNAPDRRGLTGSARLLQDVYKLDQYAFESDKRKLQISKTFSLASLFPMEFEQFKKTGEITFETSMEHFDRDFPGHYLRLIKKVKTSVIALVPPTQGIKATLLNGGISRVVIGGSIYQDVVVRRDPEMVALSGTRDATGVFELQMETPKLLNPFESTGVHSRWQFKMQKAANLFDYSTIADVLITIDYTALQSFDYEQQVIRSLGTEISSQRAFSMRNEFADQFYELTHPDEVVNRFNTVFNVRSYDFPANILDVSMTDVRFYILLKDQDPGSSPISDTEKPILKVRIPQEVGVGTIVQFPVNSKGIASSPSNPTGNPLGEWALDCTELEDLINENQILDIILVMTYEGELPKRI